MLPDRKIQTDTTEKPIAGKDRASDGAVKYDVDIAGSGLPDGISTEAAQNPPVTIPTVYNLTLTVADTEYSQAIPANTRQYRFRCRTSFAVRFAYETGHVAVPTEPYLTLPSDGDYASGNNNFTGMTLFFASPQAGVVVELECFT